MRIQKITDPDPDWTVKKKNRDPDQTYIFSVDTKDPGGVDPDPTFPAKTGSRFDRQEEKPDQA